MKKLQKPILATIAAAMLLGVVGCATKNVPPPPAPEPVYEEPKDYRN